MSAPAPKEIAHDTIGCDRMDLRAAFTPSWPSSSTCSMASSAVSDADRAALAMPSLAALPSPATSLPMFACKAEKSCRRASSEASMPFPFPFFCLKLRAISKLHIRDRIGSMVIRAAVQQHHDCQTRQSRSRSSGSASVDESNDKNENGQTALAS